MLFTALFKKNKNLGAILIVSGVMIIITSVYFFGFLPSLLDKSTNLSIGDGVFRAKLAVNDEQRIKGLSGVKELKSHQALLMAYPKEDRWGIWMKDMYVPIDIVWLDKEKKVVYIVKNASPDLSTSKTFRPTKPAKYVLELPAGTVDSKVITINKLALFDFDESKVE